MTDIISSTATASFNLWREPWIRVMALDGTRHSLSIEDVLLQAHTLKALYDPSPLTVCGVHRLLAAVLQAMCKPRELADIGEVLDEGHFAPAEIRLFATQHASRFDLFDPTAPFLQTGDVPLDAWRKPEKVKGKNIAPRAGKTQLPVEQADLFDDTTEDANTNGSATETPAKIDAKSVAYLLAEVPAGTNRTHFRHVTDDEHRLCPACCARGLVTIPAFATSGGAGIKPSINGVPPVYLLPVGDTLFQSLALSLAGDSYRPHIANAARQTAAWSGATTIARNGELHSVGYLESLTFPARRIRLFPLDDAGCCTQCGVYTPVRVTSMLFEMGQSRPKDAPLWKDPFVAYRKPTAKDTDPPKPLRPNQGKALWREYGTLFLGDAELQPALVRQLTGLVEERIVQPNQRLRFRCIGMKTDGKAKIFEWLDDALDVPPTLLRDERGAAAVREALSRADEGIHSVRFVFSLHMKPNASRDRFVTVRSRMEDEYWTALALPFRNLISTAAAPETVDQARDAWARRILGEAQRVFDEALEQIGDRADMLRRRVEAHSHCRRVLAKHRKDWNLG